MAMATESNITLPAELLAQVQALAAKEGKTADELTAQAVKRDIARRMIGNLKRDIKPSGMTEELEIQTAVSAVHESRGR
jgi:hypothetical protein